MPLAHRIIPTVLCRGRTLVKGKSFDSWRSVGLALQALKIHAARGVDEVCLLDIGATAEGRGPNLELVRELSECLFSPLAVGGGVRTVADVRALLGAGADSVVICTAAWSPTGDLVREASSIVGSQAITVAVDVRRGFPAIRGGTHPIGVPASEYAALMQARGAGEILLTAIEHEGTLQGYDLELIRQVVRAVDIPVIAHGGCGEYEHMRQAIEAGASAVAAGAMFQFTEQTPLGAAEYLDAHGITARIPCKA